ncbi:MAG: hypothetical protein PHR35_20435 [Kiritimatiellae bacterium]|nr:hypothetical protein [Kiritimatiellia bacterium]
MLLWIEGFDNFGGSGRPSPTGIMASKYLVSAENDMYMYAGRFTGYGMRLIWDSTCWLRTPGSLTTNDTVVLGFAFFQTAFGGNYADVLRLYDSGYVAMTVTAMANGDLRVYRGSQSSLLATASAPYSLGAWHYLEFKVKVNSSTGTFELRIDGSTVASGSNVNTKGGTHDYIDGFGFCGMGVNGSVCWEYDDLYFLDGSGAFNNDFLGNMRVVALRPNAGGDSTDFTPDSGDNYDRVNEAIQDEDTSYVESDTTDQCDLYNYDSLTGITQDIKGIQVNTECRETDTDPYSLITPCLSNSVLSEDSAQGVGTSTYTTRRRLMELNPDGSVVWTPDALNAVQFGVKVG